MRIKNESFSEDLFDPPFLSSLSKTNTNLAIDMGDKVQVKEQEEVLIKPQKVSSSDVDDEVEEHSNKLEDANSEKTIRKEFLANQQSKDKHHRVALKKSRAEMLLDRVKVAFIQI